MTIQDPLEDLLSHLRGYRPVVDQLDHPRQVGRRQLSVVQVNVLVVQVGVNVVHQVVSHLLGVATILDGLFKEVGHFLGLGQDHGVVISQAEVVNVTAPAFARHFWHLRPNFFNPGVINFQRR